MTTRRTGGLGPIAFTLLASAAVALAAAAGCGGSDGSGTTGGGTLGGTTSTTGVGGSGGAGGAAAAVCGNGLLEGTEECDDGNTDDADGCTTDCKLVRCGDGVVQGAEQCDDGNLDDTDACVTGCVNATCGDGLVEKGVEECDDGNQADGDGCSKDCKAESSGCGNGKVDEGEECDDGNASNADECLNTCKEARCGDGYAELGVEECDDGNQNNDDFCTNDCKITQPPDFGCPGAAIGVKQGIDTSVTGDASKAADDTSGSCGGNAAGEVVYQVTPDTNGELAITITGVGATDPVLYVREGDCGFGSEVACANATGAGGKETVTVPVKAGVPVWVFADGTINQEGQYGLDFHLKGGLDGDACPGLSAPIAPKQELLFDGDTSLAQADLKGTGACDTSGTKDLVYGIKPSADGTLYVDVDPAPGYDAQLHVRSGTCTKPANQILCEDTGGPGVSELVSFPVKAGETYYVIVDGKVGQAGPFKLDVLLD
jgi:cysteine-rich repeat protein